jgi:hypothetical protein
MTLKKLIISFPNAFQDNDLFFIYIVLYFYLLKIKNIFYLNINLGCEASMTLHPVNSESFLSTSGGGFRKNAPNKLSPIISDP